MSRVLVLYATRHGSTAQVAEAIATTAVADDDADQVVAE